MTVKLSPAQQRIYADVCEHGERRYNGRARRTIEILEGLGLVTYDYTFRFAGLSGRAIDVYTVRPAKPLASSSPAEGRRKASR